jgi:hypothetical protein
MKHFYFLLLPTLLVSSVSFAQVPNGSFEEWAQPAAGGDDAPVDWQTTNTAFSTCVTQSSDATDGDYSMQIGPTLTGFGNGIGLANATFSSAITPSEISFSVKTDLDGVDSVWVSITLQGSLNSWAGIWQAQTSIGWTDVVMPVDVAVGTVDQATITVNIGYMNEANTNLASSVNSLMWLDNFVFTGPMDIPSTEQCTPLLAQNQADLLTISTCPNMSAYNVVIYDLFGRKVADELNVISLPVGDLTPGVYLITVINDGVEVITEKRYIR